MHGEQDPALLKPAFVPLGFVLGNAHADERSGHTAHRSAHAHARQGGHNRSRGDEGSYSGDGQKADPGQQSQRSADHRARACARRGPFWSLGVLLRADLPAAQVLRQQYGNRAAGETRGHQGIRGMFYCGAGRINPEHRGLFIVAAHF